MPEQDKHTPIPDADLREMEEREDAATEGPLKAHRPTGLATRMPAKVFCGIKLHTIIPQIYGQRDAQAGDDAEFFAHARTDQPRLRIAYIAACKEIDTQAAEMEWYRSLKIVREEEGVTGIDGGEKAQMLHEMWEENVRLKAELEKKGMSREEAEDIFGGKMMNVAQQGAELLARANKIDTQAARIAKLEKGLVEAKKLHFVDRNDYYSCPKSIRGCANWKATEEGKCTCGADIHNARIDALLPKKGEKR